ncbi:MAG TPA: PLP-dependent cysteine synthase family protein [Pyrinomonadaceae bacterium]|nr:PLP-dependent cysteine synthase family protein [Pyrinomonadaceae bacterium]
MQNEHRLNTTLIERAYALSPVKTVAHQSPNRCQQLKHLIGNTPLLAIRFAFRGKERVIYAKAEHINMMGSIKDRMAFHILKKAYQEDRIQPGDTIAEATSGNTGISFAAIGRALGHPVVIFMPDWMSQERIALIKSVGARIVPVRRDQGGFLGSIQMTEELARQKPNVFLPAQFANEANVEAHEKTTGPEIWWQLFFNSIKPDAFVAGVGTGGTIMGVGQFLRQRNPAIKLHPLQPAESPTLSTGRKVGHHRIQGISDEFIPSILQLGKLDSVVSVHDGDAILMAQKLATSLGLGVGISSGANFIGALMVQNEMGDDAVVTTVFPDDNKKYLSTDLLRDEPVKHGYLAPEVELLGYEAFKRVCYTCFDGDE